MLQLVDSRSDVMVGLFGHPTYHCLDFYLWGYMKILVYGTPVDNAEEPIARIVVVAGEI